MERTYKLKITDDHIEKEFKQEGNYTIDSGGENPEARKQINLLVADAKKKVSNEVK